jgi:DNA-binding Lrp family transcriptional regulator
VGEVKLETGYILLNLKPGKKKDLINQLRKIKSLKEAKLVIGTYDAVAKIEGDSIEEIQKIYINEIDDLDGILDSRLHIVACPRTRK